MAVHLLIKLTSRSRPTRFFETLDSIVNLMADKRNYTILCTLDEDDPTMNNQEVIGRLAQFPHLIPVYGTSKSKIDAINRDMEYVTRWDILVNVSDDQKFVAYGWDELIRDGFQINAPEFDGFLFYPDSTAKNMLPTMSILGRKYYERDGYIYHPAYKSLFADNEAMEIAQARGKLTYMGIQIFDHFHPSYGLADWDEQYVRQQAMWGEDEATFNDRKAKNFPVYETQIVNLDPDHRGAVGTVRDAAFVPDLPDHGQRPSG